MHLDYGKVIAMGVTDEETNPLCLHYNLGEDLGHETLNVYPDGGIEVDGVAVSGFVLNGKKVTNEEAAELLLRMARKLHIGYTLHFGISAQIFNGGE